MRAKSKDPLHEWLDRELTALDEQVARGQTPQAGRLRALSGVVELLRARESAGGGTGKWLVAAALAATLAVVSVLLFARVHETEIELSVTATEVGFTLTTDQVLASGAVLSRLGFAGLTAVDWSQLRDLEGPSHGVNSPAISFSVVDRGERHGSVTLGELIIPKGTWVTLRRGAGPRDFHLELAAPGLALHTSVAGPVMVGVVGGRAGIIDAPAPRGVSLVGDEGVDIDFGFASLPQWPIAPELRAGDISFTRIDQFVGGEESVVRQASTVVAGSVFFESLDGSERRLRPSEALNFTRSAGVLRAVELTDAGVVVQFHGRVAGMGTGTDDARRSWMPTYLEWLRARHELALLWGSSLYLFGLVVAVLRWSGLRL
jgi:hypothetical protein